MKPLTAFLHPRLASSKISELEHQLSMERRRNQELRIAALEARRVTRTSSCRLDEALGNISSLSSLLEESAAKVAALEEKAAEVVEMEKLLEFTEKKLGKVAKMKQDYEERIKKLQKRLDAANDLLRQGNRRTFSDEEEMMDISELPVVRQNTRYKTPRRERREDGAEVDKHPVRDESQQGDWLQSLPPI